MSSTRLAHLQAALEFANRMAIQKHQAFEDDPNASTEAEHNLAKGKADVAKCELDIVKREMGVAKCEMDVEKRELEVERYELEVARLSTPEGWGERHTEAKAKVETIRSRADRDLSTKEGELKRAEEVLRGIESEDEEKRLALLNRAEKKLEEAEKKLEEAEKKLKEAKAETEKATKELKEAERKLQKIQSRAEPARKSPKTDTSTTGPSPSVSTVGKREMDRLRTREAITNVEGDGPPVLSEDEYAALQAKFFANESELVKHFTPILQAVVKDAALKTGYDLVLVNSERHPWVEDPHGGYASKPDMIVVHSALYSACNSRDDKKYSGAGFLFGLIPNFDLCDSISATVEWKVNIEENGHSALGVGLEYARRMISTVPKGVSSEKDHLHQRIMIADKKGFMLVVVVKGGDALSLERGMWCWSGSRDAIVEFFTRKREWLDAIQAACSTLEVAPVVPAPDSSDGASASSFLGRGASGRAFLVADSSHKQYALKLSLGERACGGLAREISIYRNISELCSSPTPFVTSLVTSFKDDERCFAALLLQPVGSLLTPFTMYKIEGALLSLRELSVRGVFHGDARWPNVLWVGNRNEGNAVWTDFQSADIFLDKSSMAEYFARDVLSFRESFGSLTGESEEAITAAAAEFYSDRSTLKSLVSFFQSFW